MKKLLIIPALFLAGWVSAQGLTIKTMCNAIHAHVGDTVELSAAATADNGYQNIAYKLISGPNTPVTVKDTTTYVSSLEGQNDLFLTGLTSGLYLYSITATDKLGGTMVGMDSLAVVPAIACPIIPPPRTVTTAQIQIGGIWFTLPAGTLKLTYSDGNPGTY